MKSLEIGIKLTSPGLFGGRAAEGNIRESLPYVPGSVLRGALAWQAVRAEDPRVCGGDLFDRIFLNGSVRWPDLRTSGSVFFRSHRACKSVKDASAPGDHDVVDEVWASSSAGQQYCRCGEPFKRIEPDRPDMVQITRTAIEPATRTAKDASLHSIAAVSEGQSMSGTMHSDLSDVEWSGLVSWLTDVALAPPALGGGRSAGFGEIEMSLGDAADRGSLTPRLDEWNRGTSGRRFAVSLLSPVVVRDKFWRYRRSIDAETLGECVPGLADSRLIGAWSDWAQVAGWNEAAGLPKEAALTIERGSAFLFESTLDVGDLAVELAHLEASGIGERRAEGFGNISVCDVRHLDYRRASEGQS